MRRRPYSVILLDEMEKAHPDVFNVLLQVLDDGRLTDGQGRQVSFKNTIIIMTSNVGSKAIAELSGKDEEEMRHQVDAAMAQTFRPEFLNRIDDIVVFHPLGMAQIEKIVDIQLADVRARLAKERMTLAITPAAKQMLAVVRQHAGGHLRGLRRRVDFGPCLKICQPSLNAKGGGSKRVRRPFSCDNR